MAQVLQFAPAKRSKMKPQKSDQVPITKEMLYGVRSELSAKIAGQSARTTQLTKNLKSFEDRMNAKFDGVVSRFDGIDARLNGIDARFESIDARFESIDARFESIDARLNGMDKRFDAMDKRFDAMDKRFDAMDARFDRIEKRLDKLEARFDKIDGYFAELKADIYSMKTMLGEQTSQNRFVLDGYSQLYPRQTLLEDRQNKIESVVNILVLKDKGSL
jgi:chromosome segregation ATPase